MLVQEALARWLAEEYVMANEEHLARLNKGLAAWNEWRDDHPEIVPDLRGAALAGRDLAMYGLLCLDGVDLAGADLREVYLFSGRLSGANLTGATLTNADLRQANLRRAVLREAFLLERTSVRPSSLKLTDIRHSSQGLTYVRPTSVQQRLPRQSCPGQTSLEQISVVRTSQGRIWQKLNSSEQTLGERP